MPALPLAAQVGVVVEPPTRISSSEMNLYAILPHFQVHHVPSHTKIGDSLCQSDVAVAAGVIPWERLYIGVPTVVVLWG